jgi:Ulp1 family protease
LNEDDQSEYPEFFYLDSLYNIYYRRIIIILKYLFYEYQKIYSIKCDMADFFLKNFHKIECYNPEAPKQYNSYDCGIFLLTLC